MKVAEKFNRFDVDKFSQEITYIQFVKWVKFYDLKYKETTPTQFYLAQIAMYLKAWVTGARKINIESCILDFGEPKKPKKLEPEKLAEVLKGFFGINKDK
jgi:hypothetical protein